MEIGYFDLITGGILLYAVIRGLVNGFVLELASTVAFVLGVLGAVMIGGWAEDYLGRWVQWPYLGIVAFLLVFIIVVILTYLLGSAITKVLEMTAFSFLNRLAGGVFSLFKYAFLISVALVVLDYFDKNESFLPMADRGKSYLYPYLSKLAPSIFPYIHFTTPEAFINL